MEPARNDCSRHWGNQRNWVCSKPSKNSPYYHIFSFLSSFSSNSLIIYIYISKHVFKFDNVLRIGYTQESCGGRAGRVWGQRVHLCSEPVGAEWASERVEGCWVQCHWLRLQCLSSARKGEVDARCVLCIWRQAEYSGNQVMLSSDTYITGKRMRYRWWSGKYAQVNNVGAGLQKKTEEHTLEDLSFLMTQNFESGYHISQLAYPLLKASECGSIVFVSSVSGLISISSLTGSVHGATKGTSTSSSTCITTLLC